MQPYKFFSFIIPAVIYINIILDKCEFTIN
jgi:hypothetical protein